VNTKAAGRRARRLTSDLYVHAAALDLAPDVRRRDLAPYHTADARLVGLVRRKDVT